MYHVTFPARSNRASWGYVGQITDMDDNLIDLTGTSIVFQISDKDGCPRLTASTENGKLSVVGLGMFQWFFTLQDMQGLCLGTYQTGLTLTTADGQQTEQLSVGPLPIIDGVVPTS
jgi:hypothetical protein